MICSTALSDRQSRFVAEYLVDGNGTQAAIRAGYGRAGAHVEASRLLRDPKVAAAVRTGQCELAAQHQMTRERVVQELLEAIDMARQQADPGTMIAGWREIGRLCGFYAPEVKKIDLNVSARRVIGKLEALSDAELLRLTAGTGQ
jgi:phage terminase small subunit